MLNKVWTPHPHVRVSRMRQKLSEGGRQPSQGAVARHRTAAEAWTTWTTWHEGLRREASDRRDPRRSATRISQREPMPAAPCVARLSFSLRGPSSHGTRLFPSSPFSCFSILAKSPSTTRVKEDDRQARCHRHDCLLAVIHPPPVQPVEPGCWNPFNFDLSV